MYIEFLEDPAPQAKQRKEQGLVLPLFREMLKLDQEMGNTTTREAPKVEVPELPEDYIAHIITFTSPKDACVSALVSKTFQSAADSDDVWEKFLPPDYTDILSRSVAPLNLTSKKELYFRLCSSSDPILLDGGTKCLRLEKTTGKKCLMVGARELAIVWDGHPQYWQRRPDNSSRFAEVAELIHVCWLDISGKIETGMLSPKTTYGVYIVIKHADQTNGLEEPPVDVSVSFVGGGTASGSRKAYLERSPGPNPVEGAFPREREDGWMEIEVGKFCNDLGEDGEVLVSVREVNHLHWKRGLIVEGIEFRPW